MKVENMTKITPVKGLFFYIFAINKLELHIVICQLF